MLKIHRRSVVASHNAVCVDKNSFELSVVMVANDLSFGFTICHYTYSTLTFPYQVTLLIVDIYVRILTSAIVPFAFVKLFLSLPSNDLPVTRAVCCRVAILESGDARPLCRQQMMSAFCPLDGHGDSCIGVISPVTTPAVNHLSHRHQYGQATAA